MFNMLTEDLEAALEIFLFIFFLFDMTVFQTLSENQLHTTDDSLFQMHSHYAGIAVLGLGNGTIWVEHTEVSLCDAHSL